MFNLYQYHESGYIGVTTRKDIGFGECDEFGNVDKYWNKTIKNNAKVGLDPDVQNKWKGEIVEHQGMIFGILKINET